MALVMHHDFHSEKYQSNIKKMYQNPYVLHIAIKVVNCSDFIVVQVYLTFPTVNFLQ